MSERKVINKYYPPDFDPSKITKKKKKVKTGSASLPAVRFMTPYSIRCDNCGEYTSKSRKFNARKETTNESYLGVKTIKLHIKCPSCASEIIFRTDPKSADYVLMYGAKKLYDTGNTNEVMKEESLEDTLSRLEKEEEAARQKELEKDKKTSTLEELESKLNDIRRQQEMNEELDDIQRKNARLEIDSKTLKEKRELEAAEKKRFQDEEDERLAEMAFSKPAGIAGHVPTVEPEVHSASDSDSDYGQPLTSVLSKKTPPPKIVAKRKVNRLGVSTAKKLKS